MEYLDNFLKEMARQGLTPDGLRAMASRLEGLERAAGEPPVLRVKLLGPGAVMPRRGTPGSAGLDLSAAIQAPVEVRHGEITRVPTGIAIQLDPGYVCLVFGRSGLAVKEGVAPVNAVGVVDSDYRGELAGLPHLPQAGGVHRLPRRAHRPNGDFAGFHGGAPPGGGAG